MKNILKYTLVLGIAALTLTGCIKEFEAEGSSISKEQVDAAPYGVKVNVAAIAGYTNDVGYASSVPSMYGYPSMCVVRDCYCNDMAGADTGYDWYQPFSNNTYQTGIYSHMQIIWLFYTKWLALANDVIRMYPDLSAIPDDEKPYVGAAYAYRAWAWLDMGQMYEFKENKYTSKPEVVGLTIPYLHENMTEVEARNNPRLPKAELIGHIEESIATAIELLGDFKSTDKTLPDKAVAYGLSARLNLWKGDYAAAKQAAEDALNAGVYSPLTESQWTNTTTGFNSVDSQSSWMMCARLSSESSAVKSALTNWVSWMSTETSYGYAAMGAYRLCDAQFYSQISNKDFRKKSWKAPSTNPGLDVPYIPAKGNYAGPDALDEYVPVKFRPAQGNPNDYLVAGAIDFPMMRMEEMKFIIAECDARLNNSAASLVEIVKTRNPEYKCSYKGGQLVREVFFQKRIEFWGEGVMFFDYKRCPDALIVKRGYDNSNHISSAQFNCVGLAPWMNLCINEYEAMDNKALKETNNPDPSGTVKTWK